MKNYPNLTWVGGGQLAEALGVSRHRGDVVERNIAPLIERNATLRDIFDALEALDLTFNEWTAAVFALGYLEGVLGR